MNLPQQKLDLTCKLIYTNHSAFLTKVILTEINRIYHKKNTKLNKQLKINLYCYSLHSSIWNRNDLESVYKAYQKNIILYPGNY